MPIYTHLYTGFLECLKQVILADKGWIPNQEGYSLYIRPTAIATSPYLGVQAPSHCKLYVILCPVSIYTMCVRISSLLLLIYAYRLALIISLDLHRLNYSQIP